MERVSTPYLQYHGVGNFYQKKDIQKSEQFYIQANEKVFSLSRYNSHSYQSNILSIIDNYNKIKLILEELNAILVLVEPEDMSLNLGLAGKDLSHHRNLFSTMFKVSKLKKYSTIYEIIDEFIEVRKEYYVKRKALMLQKMKNNAIWESMD